MVQEQIGNRQFQACQLKDELSDTNLFGSGVHLNLSTTYSKDEQTAMIHVAQPWLFDKPILGAFDIYHRRPVYDELRHVRTVHQKLTGGSVTLGCITQSKINSFMMLIFFSVLVLKILNIIKPSYCTIMQTHWKDYSTKKF